MLKISWFVKNHAITVLLVLQLGALGCGRNETAQSPESSNVDLEVTSENAATDRNWPCLFGPNRNSIVNDSALDLSLLGESPIATWERKIGTGYSSIVGRDDRLILFHRLQDEEIVEAINIDSAETIWIAKYPTDFQCKFNYSSGPIATPAISDHLVFALGASGILSCLDFQTGDLVWRRNLNQDYKVAERPFGVGASPLVVQDFLIVTVGGENGAGIVAFRKSDGETVWSSTNHRAGYATPVYAEIQGMKLLFIFDDVGLSCLEFNGGEHLWTIPFRSKKPDSENSTTPVVWRDCVFVSGYAKGCMAVRIKPDGKYDILWEDPRKLDNQYNNMINVGPTVIGFSAVTKNFKCLQIDSGELIWSWKSPIDRGNVLLVNRHLVELSESGHLLTAELRSNGPVIKSRTLEPVLKERCFSAPAIVSGRLLLRNEEQLKCFDLRVNARESSN